MRQSNVSDLQSLAVSAADTTVAEPGVTHEPPAASEKLRDDWDAIRDRLEHRAADPNVDGRRRAKYARIDRRRYLDLIEALTQDDALDGEAADYRDAAKLWQKYRNGRSTPTADDAAKMSTLRARLVGS